MKDKIDVRIYRTDNRAAREGQVYVELVRRNGRADVPENRVRFDYADAAPFAELGVVGIFERFDKAFPQKKDGNRDVLLHITVDDDGDTRVAALRYSNDGKVIASRTEGLDSFPELQKLYGQLDALPLEGVVMDESIALAEAAHAEKVAKQEAAELEARKNNAAERKARGDFS